MADVITVRIGLEAARELELAVEDEQAFADAFEAAVANDDDVLWVTDIHGHRFGVNVDSVAFVEIVKPRNTGVGF